MSSKLAYITSLIALLFLVPSGAFIPVTADPTMMEGEQGSDIPETRGDITTGDIMLVEGGDSPHNNSFYYSVPEGGKALSGNITIGPAPYEAGTRKYPSEVIFNIGKATPEYQYYNLLNIEGFDNGYWGYQDSISDGSNFKEFDLSSTPEGVFNIVLPKNITVRSARLNVTGEQRSDAYYQWYFDGENSGQNLGHIVKGMGDMDPAYDGDEILIGSPTYTSGSSVGVGKVYRMMNRGNGIPVYGDYIIGTKSGGQMGSSISDRFTLQDKNDYFGIGAKREGDGTEGMVHIFNARSLIPPSAVTSITGKYSLQDFGSWIEVGDITGDGDVEIAVGAPSNDSGKGAVYFYDIDHDGSRVTASLNFSIEAPSGETSFGRFMSTGDVNGDTYDDIAIAGDEKIYIYHGGPSANTTADMTLEPKLLEKVTSFSSIEFLGHVMNKDGDTLAVGCPYVDAMGASGGVVLLYAGGPSYDDQEDTIVSSTTLNAQNFGLAVDKGEDVDGDGYNEFAISAGGHLTNPGMLGYFTRNDQGSIVLTHSIQGLTASGKYGFSMDLGPDLFNDGHQDLMVGTPLYSTTGRAQLIDWYDLSALPDNMPSISVNDNVAWTYQESRLSDTVTTPDISAVLNEELADEPVWWRDGYNDYVMLSFKITCPTSNPTGSSTIFNITGIDIEYEYPILIEDIHLPINSFLGTQTKPEDDGTFHVPFKFTSVTPGGLKVENLFLDLDLPPAVEYLPQTVFHMNEDSISENLLDLWAVFEDDITPDDELDYFINRKDSNISVQVLLNESRYVRVDSLTGDQNDNWTGQVIFTISGIDENGARTHTGEITVHIMPVNDAPGILPDASPNTVVVQDKSWEYRNYAYDCEGDTIYYDLEGPEGMTVDGNGTITWVATNDYVGMNIYTIILSDGMDERRITYFLEVINENDRPYFVNVPDRYCEIFLGDTFVYQVLAEDVDPGDLITYFLVEGFSPTGAVIDHDDGTITWTPAILFDEPQLFRIRAEDLEGDSVTYEFYVNMSLRLSAPSFTSQPTTGLYDMIPWEYEILVDDPNGEYDLELFEGPEGLEYNHYSQKLVWTPGYDQVGQFRVTVNLTSFHYLVQQNFTLTVERSQRNWNLRITGPEDLSKAVDIVNVIGTVNVTPSEVLWLEVKVGEGDWMELDPEEESFSYSIDTNKYDDGDLTIKVRAWDGYMYSDEETITIKVANHEGETSPLLIVVLILAALLLIGSIAFIGILAYRKQMEKDREEERKAKLEEIKKSKEEMDSFIKEQTTLTEEAYQDLVSQEEEVVDFDKVMEDLTHKADIKRDEVTESLMEQTDKIAYLPGEEQPQPMETVEGPSQQEPPEGGEGIDKDEVDSPLPQQPES